MKAIVNGVEVEGTIEEIQPLLSHLLLSKLGKTKRRKKQLPNINGFGPSELVEGLVVERSDEGVVSFELEGYKSREFVEADIREANRILEEQGRELFGENINSKGNGYVYVDGQDGKRKTISENIIALAKASEIL